MFRLTIPEGDIWDEFTETFTHINGCVLQLEHSLVSLSKWESKWCKPFLSKDTRTREETEDYVRCMTITQNVDPNVYRFLTDAHIQAINDYIAAPMTATWFNEGKGGRRGNSEQVTSELIYYWMIALNIPFECQKWHLNRLLTLVKVCNIKNQPEKKMSRREAASRNAALNAQRRARLKSKG